MRNREKAFANRIPLAKDTPLWEDGLHHIPCYCLPVDGTTMSPRTSVEVYQRGLYTSRAFTLELPYQPEGRPPQFANVEFILIDPSIKPRSGDYILWRSGGSLSIRRRTPIGDVVVLVGCCDSISPELEITSGWRQSLGVILSGQSFCVCGRFND